MIRLALGLALLASICALPAMPDTEKKIDVKQIRDLRQDTQLITDMIFIC